MEEVVTLKQAKLLWVDGFRERTEMYHVCTNSKLTGSVITLPVMSRKQLAELRDPVGPLYVVTFLQHRIQLMQQHGT